MTAPVKYVMRGQMPTPPYQEVTWSVYNSPDTTGAQSGYGAGFLINIFVDYTVTDNVVSGGNQQAAQIPPPPAVVTPKVTYVMKGLCSVTTPANQLVTWQSPNNPDYAGNLSGFPTSSVSNVVVDYTINDNVTSGPSAVAVIPTGDLAGDVNGPTTATVVVGLQLHPISAISPTTGQVLQFNGTQWAPAAFSTTLSGDVTGPLTATIVQGLVGRPLSATAPTTNQVLTWNGSFWIPANTQSTSPTGTAGGDLSGTYPNPSVVAIRGNPVSSSAPAQGQFLIENSTGTGSAWTNLTGDVNASVSTVGKITVTGLQGRSVASTAPSDGQVLLWVAAHSDWEPSSSFAGSLGGDVTGVSSANTVVKIQNRSVSSAAPSDGYVLTWVAAHSDWEPLAITSGSTTLIGDVTGPASSNTVVKLQNRSVASTAPNNFDVLTWQTSHTDWEPVAASALPVVAWAGDLAGSNNTTQTVSALKSANGTGLLPIGAAGVTSYTMKVQNPTIFTLAGYDVIAGSLPGGDITIEGGNNTTANNNTFGGNIHLIGGFPGSGTGGMDGYVDISSGPVIATFASDHIKLDASVAVSSASLTLNSGTGGTSMTTSGAWNATVASASLVSNTSSFVIDGKNSLVLKLSGTPAATIQAGEILLGTNISEILFDSSLTSLLLSQAGATTSSISTVVLQGQNSSAGTGGTVAVASGIGTGGTANGTLLLQTGNTSQVTLTPTNITVAYLAGIGTSFVSADSSGVLTRATASASGGDISGTWPILIVDSISGPSPIFFNASNLRWGSNQSAPLIDQLNLPNTNTPEDGYSFTIKAQSGTSAISGNTNGGNGGKLILSSGAGGTHTGSGTDGTNGSILFQIAGTTDLTISTAQEQWADVGNITYNQAQKSGTGANNGSSWTIKAQQGQQQTGTNANNNGGNLVLASGSAGTGGSGAAGAAGNIILETDGTTSLTISPANITVAAFTSAGVVHNDASGNLSSSLIVNADVSSSAAIAVSKLAAGSNGQVLETVSGVPTWSAPPPTVTWASDLVNSTNSNQWVAAISGNAGAGGTVPLNITTLQFASGQSSPTINQATISSGSGQEMVIQAQSATGASHNGGNLVLASGLSGSANDGYVALNIGGSSNGLTLNATGVVTIANLSTGIVHSDSSGNLTSSLIVNADVSSSAAIAVSKLAIGTADQLLDTNHGATTAEWFTLGGDATFASHNLTVTGIQGNTFTSGSPTKGQFVVATSTSNYGPVTLSGDISESATTAGLLKVVGLQGNSLPAPTGTNTFLEWSGSALSWGNPAVTWGSDLVNSTQTNQYVSSLSYSSSSAGGTIGINGTGSALRWASGNTGPVFNQAALASTSAGSGSNGVAFTIASQAGQAATGASNNGGNGGDLDLSSGAGGTSGSATAGSAGNINLEIAGTQWFQLIGNTTAHHVGDIILGNPSSNYGQTQIWAADATAGNAGNGIFIFPSGGGSTTGAGFAGGNFEVVAGGGSNAVGSGDNGGAGGNVIITAGSGGAGAGGGSAGANGTVQITGGTVQLIGTVNINGFGTGVVHSDSSGNLTSSLIVNADVNSSAAIAYSKLNLSGSIVNADINSSAAIAYSKLNLTGDIVNADISSSAAIAVSKLANGTADQLLDTNHAGTTTEWFTLGGDATFASHNLTVTGLQGNSLPSPSGTNTVLVWSGSVLSWASPGGVTWANDLSGSTSSNQYINSISGNAGGGGTVALNITTLQFASGQTSVALNQASTSSGSGTSMTVQAQGATGASHNGGNLNLSSGTSGSATVGTVNIQTGGTTRLSISPSNVTIAAFSSAGVVHNDSSGNLSSSNIVNADVDSAAAIAVSKLAAGSAGQLLMSNATPTPTWTTVSGDVSIGLGGTTVVSISGLSPVVITTSEFQWGSSTSSPLLDQAAKSSTSAGSGSNGQNFSITAQAGQAATGASHNGGNGGNIVLTAGAGGTSGSATAGVPGYVNIASGLVTASSTKTGNYTMTYADYRILANPSSGFNLTLPAPISGLTFEVWDISGTAETNNITLVRNGSEKISGVAASRILQTNWGKWTIVSDGTDWYVG